MLAQYIEAEYESGFVLREDEQDHSPYDRNRNIFHAILNKRPEAVHGPLVCFTFHTPEHDYHYEWSDIPENVRDNARPIRVMHMSREFDGAMNPKEDPQRNFIEFGAQWTVTDANGRQTNVKDTIWFDKNGEVVEDQEIINQVLHREQAAMSQAPKE